MSGAPLGEQKLPAQIVSKRKDLQTGTKKKTLRGDIEGLRAIAVGTVLIYHVGFSFMPGGYVGVDVFFVISGFLITSLLLREAAKSGRISLADFYARRARRLLPAASVVLLFTAAAGSFVLPGQDKLNLGSDVIAATLYVINWALAFRSVDYLAEDAAPSALQHYWSLSVEEQFYVVWPLVIMLGIFIAKRTRARTKPLLFGMLTLIAAVSFIHSVLHTKADPQTAYFYTTTRVWELAIGALLAFLVVRLSRLPRALAEIIGGVGLLLVLWSAFFLTNQTPWPGSWALAPTVGAALVIAAGCASSETVAARLLSVRPMVWIGGLSYAIYLWHWPLIILAKQAYPGLRLRYVVVLGLLSIALAWLTKHLVEDPIRFHPGLSAKASRGLLFGGATMLVTSLVGMAVLASAPSIGTDRDVPGATALVADTDAEVWSLRPDPQAAFTTSGDLVPDPAMATLDVPSYYDDDCQVTSSTQVDTTCTYGDKDGETVVALVGDSKMGQWFPAFDEIAKQEGWRIDLYLKSTCAFALGDSPDAPCVEFTKNSLELMRSDQRRMPDVVISSQGADDIESEHLAAPLRELKASGAKIVVVGDNQAPSREVYTCVEEAGGKDYAGCGFDPKEIDPSLSQAADLVGALYLPANEWICPPGVTTCPPAVGGSLIYRQGSHITATYARTMTPVIWRELAAAGIAQTPADEITVEDIPEPTGSARG